MSGTVQQQSVVERIRNAVGEKGLITDPAGLEPYVVDWRRFYRGTTPAVVRPASTSEVSAVMKICDVSTGRFQ